jgi:hypothetical protein
MTFVCVARPLGIFVIAIAWIMEPTVWTPGSSAKACRPPQERKNMELRGVVPAIVPAPPPEPFAVQVIIVDWLYREVDGLAEIKMPVLQHIVGHRNREVYEYLELTHDVRDSRAAAIYSA